jgi:hypothetical protein
MINPYQRIPAQEASGFSCGDTRRGGQGHPARHPVNAISIEQ